MSLQGGAGFLFLLGIFLPGRGLPVAAKSLAGRDPRGFADLQTNSSYWFEIVAVLPSIFCRLIVKGSA